ALLRLPDLPKLLPDHARLVGPGRPVGHADIEDLCPSPGPGRDRSGRPELRVIGVGEHHHCAVESHSPQPSRMAHVRPGTRPLRGPLHHPKAPADTSEEMAAGRTPQLTTRLALGSLLLFVSIGAVLAFLVSGQLRGRQEQAATYHAEFVAGSILRYELTPQDVAQPVDPRSARYQYLQEIVRKRLLAPPVVRLKLWRDDGTIVLS